MTKSRKEMNEWIDALSPSFADRLRAVTPEEQDAIKRQVEATCSKAVLDYHFSKETLRKKTVHKNPRIFSGEEVEEMLQNFKDEQDPEIENTILDGKVKLLTNILKAIAASDPKEPNDQED